jgi:hypothetical protein
VSPRQAFGDRDLRNGLSHLRHVQEGVLHYRQHVRAGQHLPRLGCAADRALGRGGCVAAQVAKPLLGGQRGRRARPNAAGFTRIIQEETKRWAPKSGAAAGAAAIAAAPATTGTASTSTAQKP